MNPTEKWLETYFDEVDPMAFYRSVFPAGELDANGLFTPGKYIGLCVGVDQSAEGVGAKIIRKTITDELEAVREACESDYFFICSPISYVGKRRTADNARYLYALAVDVDRLRELKDGTPIGIRNLYSAQVERAGFLPRPTYIVSSGTGVHLYYVFEQPIPLYREIVRELSIYKHELTKLLWNGDNCDIRNEYEIQQESIFQGFRMPGTKTKVGTRARAFETGERVSVEYLNSFVREKYRIKNWTAKERNGLTLKQAREKYPDWYERRVVRGEPRGAWRINRALYDWWLKRIREEAVVGHRYHCVMTLAMYAQKCSFFDERKNPHPVTFDELENDAYALVDLFDSRTDSEDNHFSNADVLAALEAFNERYIMYPRRAIEYKSGIQIPATKRNYQTQEEHLEEARAIRDIRMRRQGRKWYDGGGRPSKEQLVVQWQQENPNGTKAACIRETGISKATVYKHWQKIEGGEQNDD